MADLVTLQALKDNLGITDGTQDALLQPILDGVEAAFEAQCNRADIPFQAAPGSPVTEVHDGTGGTVLFTHYPITSMTTIAIGPDPNSPLETLDAADVAQIRFATGKRKVNRADGKYFGAQGDPRVVRATYQPADDLPADAKSAVLRVATAVWGQKGSEGFKSQGIGSFSHTVDLIAEGDPVWGMAVAANRRVRNL